MAKLCFLVFVWGPAMLGFSLAWLVRHPSDWTGPAVVGPVGALITLFTYRWGYSKLTSATVELRQDYIIGMSAGALLGVGLFFALSLGMIG